MKLYHFPMSPNSVKVLAVVHETGASPDLEMIDLTKGAQLAPEYGDVNPNKLTPCLDDDGFVLWESNAIMQYLAARHPESALLPTDARGQADVTRWLCWQLAHWGVACGTLSWERLVKGMLGQGDADPAAVEQGEEAFRRWGAVLNGHLAGRDWLVGDGRTIADFAVGAPLMYAGPAGYPMDGLDEVRRWFGNVSALESWKKAQPGVG